MSKESGNYLFEKKYRPQNFEEIIGHEKILFRIREQLKKNKLDNYIFYGPHGVGKGSVVEIIAKKLYETNYQSFFLDINANHYKGVDLVRTIIKPYTANKGIFSGVLKCNFRLIFLDELELLSHKGQFDLRRIVDDSNSTTRFIVATNYLESIKKELRDRFITIHFNSLDISSLIRIINHILMQEKKDINETDKKNIAEEANGSARATCKILQNFLEGGIIYNEIKDILSNDFNSFIEMSYKHNPHRILKKMHKEILMIPNNGLKAQLILKLAGCDRDMALEVLPPLQLQKAFIEMKILLNKNQ